MKKKIDGTSSKTIFENEREEAKTALENPCAGRKGEENWRRKLVCTNAMSPENPRTKPAKNSCSKIPDPQPSYFKTSTLSAVICRTPLNSETLPSTKTKFPCFTMAPALRLKTTALMQLEVHRLNETKPAP